MQEALKEARKGLDEFVEVPVGCVFIHNSEIIARGHNLVNLTKNPTRHAECESYESLLIDFFLKISFNTVVCIDQVLTYCSENSLKPEDVFKEVTVVVSVEPCVMCMSALYDLQIKEIFYGCRNDRFGGSTVVDVANLVVPSTKLVGGINEKEAMDLLKEFYTKENSMAPAPAKRSK